jgi:hypothetical protein
VIANGCYRWLASRLKGFAKSAPKHLYRRFVETAGTLIRFPEIVFVGWAPPTSKVPVGGAHPTQIKPGKRMTIQNDRLIVTFDRGSHNPILREASLDRDSLPIPWLGQRKIQFAYRQPRQSSES